MNKGKVLGINFQIKMLLACCKTLIFFIPLLEKNHEIISRLMYKQFKVSTEAIYLTSMEVYHVIFFCVKNNLIKKMALLIGLVYEKLKQ